MPVFPSVKGIFLDIGWTLNYPASGQWMIPLKALEYMDSNVFDAIPKPIVGDAFSQGMDYLNKNHLVKSESDEYQQFLTFYRLVFKRLPELELSKEQVESIAYDKVYNDENYLFYDDVRSTIEALSMKYRLGIISDTWPSAKRVLCNYGIYDFFHSITFSCYLGVYKPHPKMYEHALGAMGIPAEHTLFVDDSVANLEGAAKHGICPVLIVRKENAEGCDSFTNISKVSELLTCL